MKKDGWAVLEKPGGLSSVEEVWWMVVYSGNMVP